MRNQLFPLVTVLVCAAANADESAVRAALERNFPQSPIQGIAATPIADLFEAVVEGQVIYVTGDGRYILGGPLVDASQHVNLTEARLDKLNAIPWDSLLLDLAIKRIKRNGTRRIPTFDDPDCPYCKVLEQTLNGLDDVTVYALLYPIDPLHPQAAAKSKAVWCVRDRAKAWIDTMSTGAVPANGGDCDDPLAKIAGFATQHRISGTPTTVLSDGRRIVGALPLAELEKQLLRAARP